MIYDEYVKYVEKFSKQYGERMIVLMEIGGFYEMYGVCNQNEVSGSDMDSVSTLLNIHVSRKNKNILENSRTNPLMAGFPSHSLKKFVDIFIANNYTVILVEQVTQPPSPKRAVTRIISPSTYTENINSYMVNVLLVVFIEKLKSFKGVCDMYSIAYTTVDVSTGNTQTHETCISIDLLYGEFVRLEIHYQPKEIVYISEDYYDIQLPGNGMIHNKIGGLKHCFTLIQYQTEVLSKVFPNTGLLSKIEYMNLETSQASLVSFVYMIQFLYEHNETWIQRVKKPSTRQNKDVLRLHGDVVTQLNVVGNKKCLIELINNCVTNAGKRYLKHRILNPSSDTVFLNEEYSLTHNLLETGFFVGIREELKNVCDIERIFHKESMVPSQLISLHTSIKFVLKLKKYVTICPELENEINRFMDCLEDHFEIEKASACMSKVVSDNIFKTQNKFEILESKIATIQEYFNNKYESCYKGYLKFEVTDKDGFVFTTTKKRSVDLKRMYPHIEAEPINKTMFRIFESDFFEHNRTYCELKEEYTQILSSHYDIILTDIFNEHSQTILKCVRFIEKYDFHSTNAYNAARFKYTRPIIKGDSSYFDGKNIRHPIIERVQNNIPYVANDVYFDKDHPGKLVFGINSSGKSSLMKSTGLIVIMAQAGMFVPADAFHYYPYESIFTRIVSGDNIYKSQSTFTAEMLELRNILKFSTERSLVLGDELCSGTESVSAVSLVASGIVSLIERKTTFMFATHLHELTKIECIKKLDTLKIHHLSVRYSDETNTIYYDRILKDGPSNTLYGLEVCKSLDMPLDFLHRANQIRQNIVSMSDEFVIDSPSHYNSKVYKDHCKICKTLASEIHHIRFQKDADTNNMIGRHHKNVEHNLVSLCSECHRKIHSGDVTVSGYIYTNKGILLDYSDA
jgi:DNA mismatch repair protein MutS